MAWYTLYGRDRREVGYVNLAGGYEAYPTQATYHYVCLYLLPFREVI